MNKMIIVFAVILMLSSNPLAACIIEIAPDSKQVKIGDMIPLTVVLKYEHRRCVIELKDTQFKPSGLEIIEKTDWQTVSSGVYSLKMKVLIKNSKATLAVVRECEKKGISEEVLKFKVI